MPKHVKCWLHSHRLLELHNPAGCFKSVILCCTYNLNLISLPEVDVNDTEALKGRWSFFPDFFYPNLIKIKCDLSPKKTILISPDDFFAEFSLWSKSQKWVIFLHTSFGLLHIILSSLSLWTKTFIWPVVSQYHTSCAKKNN